MAGKPYGFQSQDVLTHTTVLTTKSKQQEMTYADAK